MDGTNATFSKCGLFRYVLDRTLPPSLFAQRDGYVLFVMLNPSIASETKDDPTWTKCRGFAERWGFSRVKVGNLFAWVSTNPKALRNVVDPVGLDNDAMLAELAAGATRIVCAWGANVRKAPLRDRAEFVQKLLRANARPDVEIVALRLLEDGIPEHPLYIPYSVEPVPFGPQLPANTNDTVVATGTER
ncbi:MAG: DUF1643 domain-containing protein [Polyangiales bacterium]